MELLSGVFVAVVSAVFGMIAMLIIQYYIIAKYVQRTPVTGPPKKPHYEKYTLPEGLKKHLESNNQQNNEDKQLKSSAAISLMLQFLFHELRHRDAIKRWMHRKLSLEFDELLTKTTTGKFFEAVTIRDLHLGSQFPDIKNIYVESVKTDNKQGHIDTLCLCLDIDYSGNFQLSVDAKMKFGKTAYLSIKVNHISGLARLHFTRIPYTHWSLSFYSEPALELAVESQFQGRQLQANITSLIINQIKKAIKRKHTLPNYKIRYKPFFTKADPGQIADTEVEDDELQVHGQLEATSIEMTRLCVNENIIESVYCIFAIDTRPWVSLRAKQDENDNFILTVDVVISKQKQQNLGVVFKNESFHQRTGDNRAANLYDVVVETIVPNSPASLAGLKRGDRIISIEGKNIQTAAQVAKVFKSLNLSSYSVRLERVVSNYRIIRLKETDLAYSDPNEDTSSRKEISSTESLDKRSPTSEGSNDDKSFPPKNPNSEGKSKTTDYKIPKILSSSNENVTKLAHTIGHFSLRKRKISVDKPDKNSSDSGSTKNSPNVSPQHDKNKQSRKPVDIQICDFDKRKSIEYFDESFDRSYFPKLCYESAVAELGTTVLFNEDYMFNLKKEDKYLNVNVWGKKKDGSTEDVLLGYINISLMSVLSECRSSMLGHYINCYSFLPPDVSVVNSQTNPLFSHSGFEPCLCFGDILLSFMWSDDGESDTASDLRKSTEELLEAPEYEETSGGTGSQSAKHDFIRTHFHRATMCDFCGKKIWLKDAVQCRECAMCCHKKCVAKCQTGTVCCSSVAGGGTPGVIADLVEDEVQTDCGDRSPGEQKQNFASLVTSVSNNSMKRVNSVNNLTIPGINSTGNQNSTRSLPPSPQHTPSRKQSLISQAGPNVFATCPDLLENGSIDAAVEHLLQCGSYDEGVMDAAKEASRTLYADLEAEQRVAKINDMISKLKTALDGQTNEHLEMTQRLQEMQDTATNKIERAKLAFLVGQSDAKVHALSILMLYYCSGLQFAHECSNKAQ